MKRVSRITANTAVLFLVLALMLAWTGGQGAWAGTIPWSSTGQFGYSRVESLAWNGTDTLYAGCENGHVYSKTGAGSWTDTGNTGSSIVYSLAWNGTDTLYAGCENGRVYSKIGAGSWTDTGGPGGSVHSLVWNGTDTLYAGGSGGHVYSKTGAGSWTDTGATGGSYVFSLAWNGTTLYAGCGNGHVYSKTGAGSWTDTGVTGGSTVSSLAWNGTTLYAGCDNGHVYSKTGAGSWTDTANTGGGYVFSLAWNGTTLFAGCNNGHVYSKTGAGSWTDTGGPGGICVYSLAWNGTDTLYAACYDGHVYSKTGAGSWTDIGGPGSSIVYSLAWNGTDTLYAGGSDGQVYSKTGAGSWTDTGHIGGITVYGLAWNGTTLYSGCSGGHIYSKTGAGSWTDTGATGGSSVYSLAWNGTDTLYAGCWNGHVYSSTGGGSWTDTGGPGSSIVYSLAWNGTDTLYAGSNNGQVYSKTGGGTWNDYGAIGGGWVYSLAWNGTTLYAGCGNGHVYSKTGAGSWTDTGATGSGYVYSLAWNGTTLYAGCGNGHVYSKTGAGSWTDTGATGGSNVYSLVWNGTNTLYAGCENGVFGGVPGPSTHTITASCGPNGTISPSGAVTVDDGADQTFNITPAAHYHVATLTVDSSPVTPASSYTFHTVTTDHTIAATFAMTTHTVTASAGANGTISPSGAVTVNDGANQAFTIKPDANYHVAGVKVDGSSVGALTSYTFHNVTANHTITATFASDQQQGSTWYLAEGSTAWGFDCYISIENPNTSAVHASITYMTGTGNVSGGTITLPAMSQTTVNPADKLGSKDFSTKITCSEGKTIAVDRTMSWTGPGAASPEGHSSVGVTAPAKTWYLAEGSSDWGFECWLLIQNPNSTAATAQVTYMIEGGAPVTKTKTVPANTRKTFNMADDIGAKDASIKVVSNIPVIPERAMYRNNRREGHDSIGTTTPAANYYLAEGTTAYGFTTYVLVQNPNSSPASVTLTYMTPSGAKPQAAITLPANSRKTINVNDVAGMGSTDFSTKVTCSKPIIAERAMYWGAGTTLGEACHDSIGMNSPHTTFYLPDGQSSNGRETYTLVQNPNSSAVTVQISYLTNNGQGDVVKTETIPANSRKTFDMASHSGINGRASIMVTSKTAGKKIMVERSMYWNNRGAGTDTIGGYSD